MNSYDAWKMESRSSLSETDRAILNSYAGLLPAFSAVLGGCCLVVLRSAEEKTYPCIAVENGAINQTSVGDAAPNFIVDAIGDEDRSGQRNIIGPYITKSQDEHSIKCVVYIIRNSEKRVIGCLCIGIDISMPVNVFFENLMLKVDERLAEGISEPKRSSVPDIDLVVKKSMINAQEKAGAVKGISATERNRLIVQQLKDENIFNVRGAVNIVANELGVSRYTIYNYLKDIAGNEKN